MRRLTLLAVALCLTLNACARKEPTKPSASTEPANVGPYVIGKPVRYKNLTLYPVLSKTEKKDDRFITLDEGLKAGTVEIFEVGAESPNGNAGLGRSIFDNPNERIVEDPFASQPDARETSAFVPLVKSVFATQQLWAPMFPKWMQVTTYFAAPVITRSGPPRSLVAAWYLYGPVKMPNIFDSRIVEFLFGGEEPAEHVESNVAPSSGGTVNQLMVRNTSGKPLYLMPGEVVVGGSQDRTIGQETVIASSDKAVPIDVFCVEHGRWGSRKEEQSAEIISQLASFDSVLDEKTIGKLAKQTGKGKFVISAGSLSKGSRLAALGGSGNQQGQQGVTSAQPLTPTVGFLAGGQQGQQGLGGNVTPTQNQQGQQGPRQRATQTGGPGFFDPPPRRRLSNQDDVWNRVARANAMSGNTASSGAFTGNYADKNVVAKLKPYIDGTQKTVAETQRVVGVIVVINGRVETIDIFESTPLFRKLWPKLLKSYALDAAVTAKAKTATAVCTVADARKFLRSAMRGKVISNQKTPAGLRVTKRATGDIVSFAVTDSKSPKNDESDFPSSVHAAAFSKPVPEAALGN